MGHLVEWGVQKYGSSGIAIWPGQFAAADALFESSERRTMDRLWGMEIFVRVVECGSFSKAAESLNLANATVTSNLRNLEKHLGVTLIQRNTRHLRLTEEGQAFLPRCRE